MSLKHVEPQTFLQCRTLELFKEYPKNKTKKEYACLLCWDIRISQKKALEDYIEPMIEHGILVPSGNNCYCLSSEYEK
jgi:capsule polysaccharide export protein KpsC/LpsZ